MTYKEQIKHPKWQERRLQIMKRDNFMCKICGEKETTLHVHHYYYDNSLRVWEYPDNSLITYCETCHKEWHKTKSDIDKMLGVDLFDLLKYKNIIDKLSFFNFIDFDHVSGVIDLLSLISLDKTKYNGGSK